MYGPGAEDDVDGADVVNDNDDDDAGKDDEADDVAAVIGVAAVEGVSPARSSSAYPGGRAPLPPAPDAANIAAICALYTAVGQLGSRQ